MEKKEKRVQRRIWVGPLFIKVLEEQKKVVVDYTYDTIKISDYEACEIIAKKILNMV